MNLKYYIIKLRQFFLRKRIKNKNITIISNNCIGGLLYNLYGIQFQSPTINLFLDIIDFLTLVENLDDYIKNTSLIPLESSNIVKGSLIPKKTAYRL